MIASRPSGMTSRLANMPTPPGSPMISLLSTLRHAAETQAVPLPHAGVQSVVGVTQVSGSPKVALFTHESLLAHRPAQPRAPVATVVIVQSLIAFGDALLARASRSSVVRVFWSPVRPVAMYAIAGWPSAPIASFAYAPISSVS